MQKLSSGFIPRWIHSSSQYLSQPAGKYAASSRFLCSLSVRIDGLRVGAGHTRQLMAEICRVCCQRGNDASFLLALVPPTALTHLDTRQTLRRLEGSRLALHHHRRREISRHVYRRPPPLLRLRRRNRRRQSSSDSSIDTFRQQMRTRHTIFAAFENL